MLPDESDYPGTIALPQEILEPPSPFMGRVAEIEALLTHIRPRKKEAVVINLHGASGVGKTALAQALAKKLTRSYSAQFYVKVHLRARALTPAEVITHVIRAYDPMVKATDELAELREAYQGSLGVARTLLLLDDARDVRDVQAFLPPAGMLLLVVSTAPLSLPDVYHYEVRPLSREWSRALLCKLASRLKREDAAVEQIAALCDDLPLALCLAGGLLNTQKGLPVSDYVRRLERESRRLKTRGALPALQASYDLLPAEARRLWRGVAVFSTGFDLPSAAMLFYQGGEPDEESVKEQSANSIQNLAALTGCGLLENYDFGEESPYFELHDLTRQFAERQLPKNERTELARRHASYCLSAAATIHDLWAEGNVAEASALLDQEWGNLRAAFAYAAAEVKQSDAAAELVVDYLAVLAILLPLRVPPRERLTWLDHGLAAARHLQDRKAEGACLGELGNTYQALGELRRATKCLEQAAQIAQEIGDQVTEALWLSSLAETRIQLGETEAARELLERTAHLTREFDDRNDEITFLAKLGGMARILDDARQEANLAERMLQVGRESGDRLAEHSAAILLADIHERLGEPRRAIEYLEQALQVARKIGDRQDESLTLINLGAAHSRLGQLEPAMDYYVQALKAVRARRDRAHESQILGNLGTCYLQQGKPDEAMAHCQQAARLSCTLGDRVLHSAQLNNLATAEAQLGKLAAARRHLDQALRLYREMGNRSGEMATWGNLGGLYAQMGNYKQAENCYERSLEIARESGNRDGEASALYNRGLARHDLHKPAQAIADVEAALSIWSQTHPAHAENARRKLAEWSK